MDLSPPLSRPHRILLRDWLRHGMAIAGEYGWTAYDWAEQAGVPWLVLHGGLEGRLEDEAGSLALVRALGIHLRADGADGMGMAVQVELPPARKAPMASLACQACGRRSVLEEDPGRPGHLRCRACLLVRPYLARVLAAAVAPARGGAGSTPATPGLVTGT